MRKKSVLVINDDGTRKRMYVRLSAIMSSLVAMVDGVRVTYFGSKSPSGPPYMEVIDAIDWLEREMLSARRLGQSRYEMDLEAKVTTLRSSMERDLGAKA